MTMADKDRGKLASEKQYLSVSRRNLLKTTGTIGITGLAGCSSSNSSSSNSSSSNSSNLDNIYLGVQVPLSGPYGAQGQALANAIEMAADDAVNNGEFSNINVKVSDTQSDANTGRQKAQEHINNGADLLAGNISSSTALAVGQLAQSNDIVYDCVAGSNAVTGSDCMKSTFAWSDSAVMQLGGSLGYVLENNISDGKEIFMISADYSWGQSLADWTSKQLVPKYNLDMIGKETTPFGNSDYSGVLTKVNNADPDILLMNMSGTDEITSLPQVKNYGILDDTTVVYAATTLGDAKALDQSLISHDNYYSSLAWYWNHEYSKASKEIVDRYIKRYPDANRGGYIGCLYGGVSQTLTAISNAGSTSINDVRGELEGAKIQPQFLGIGEKMRACDHRATIGTSTVQGKSPSKASGQDLFEVVNVPTLKETLNRMRTCNQTGCQI